MKIKCYFCEQILDVATSDKKATLEVAKLIGWKKLTEIPAAVCPICFAEKTKTNERSCATCVHSSHADQFGCGAMDVCENWMPDTGRKNSENYPTWEDMHKKRYGEFFQR